MNQEADDTFIDLQEKKEEMDEETAREIFMKMLLEQGINLSNETRIQIPGQVIKEFKERTRLSIRNIATLQE